MRVPAVLVSPWVAPGTVINDVFDHASIPATMTEYFLGEYAARSPREIAANTFLGTSLVADAGGRMIARCLGTVGGGNAQVGSMEDHLVPTPRKKPFNKHRRTRT